MRELERERQHLAKAERDIVEGEERVTRQTFLIDELRRDGHDVAGAEVLLATMQQTLEEFRQHRGLILAEITRLESRHPETPARR
jgi:hypothetical protein